MGLDSALQNAISAVTKAIGTDVVLIQNVTGSYDTTLGETRDTEVQYSVKATISFVTERQARGDIHVGDIQLEVSAGDIDVDVQATEWRVLFRNRLYDVVMVAPIMAQSLPMSFIITARERGE